MIFLKTNDKSFQEVGSFLAFVIVLQFYYRVVKECGENNFFWEGIAEDGLIN